MKESTRKSLKEHNKSSNSSVGAVLKEYQQLHPLDQPSIRSAIQEDLQKVGNTSIDKGEIKANLDMLMETENEHHFFVFQGTVNTARTLGYDVSTIFDIIDWDTGVTTFEEPFVIEQDLIASSIRRVQRDPPGFRGLNPLPKTSDRPARLHPSAISPHRWLPTKNPRVWVCQIGGARVTMPRPNIEPPALLDVQPGQVLRVTQFEENQAGLESYFGMPQANRMWMDDKKEAQQLMDANPDGVAVFNSYTNPSITAMQDIWTSYGAVPDGDLTLFVNLYDDIETRFGPESLQSVRSQVTINGIGTSSNTQYQADHRVWQERDFQSATIKDIKNVMEVTLNTDSAANMAVSDRVDFDRFVSEAYRIQRQMISTVNSGRHPRRLYNQYYNVLDKISDISRLDMDDFYGWAASHLQRSGLTVEDVGLGHNLQT